MTSIFKVGTAGYGGGCASPVFPNRAELSAVFSTNLALYIND